MLVSSVNLMTGRDRRQTPHHVLPGSSRDHVQPSEASLPDSETFLLFRMLPKKQQLLLCRITMQLPSILEEFRRRFILGGGTNWLKKKSKPVATAGCSDCVRAVD